jgi:hypothetical protein
MVAHARGDSAQAAAIIEQSSDLWGTVGNRSIVAWTDSLSGEVFLELERLDEAAAVLRQSLPAWREIGSSWGAAWALNTLGHLARVRGDLKEALQHHRESLGIRRGLQDLRGTVECLEGIAGAALAGGEARVAAQLLGAAGRVREEIGVPRPRRERQLVEAQSTSLAGKLGTEQYNQLTAEGRQLTLEDAYDLTLVSPSI